MSPEFSISDLNIFLVGGAVRDRLLNRDVIERDWMVVGATVEQMLGLGFQQVGKDFPVFLHPTSKEEYALARTERKSGKGYTGFTCYAAPDVTIEEDLARRDLTVNAIAISDDGKFIDPYNGCDDIKKKILRHVSPAFSEDPLRVLRVARFAARYHHLGFSVADETIALMAEIVQAGEIDALTPERIWKEMSRALMEQNPEVFFTVLKECGALKALWPALDELWGIPNPAKHHPEICSGIHTMMVLQQSVKLSDELDVRFAALTHDLGKTITPKDDLPSHRGHEQLGLPLVEEICLKFKVPNDIKRLALLVCEYHLHSHKALELKPTTLLKLFDALDIWRNPAILTKFMLACEADARGRTGFENIEYPQGRLINQAGAAAMSVTAKPFVEQGLKGLQIKAAMRDARIDAITAVKQSFAASH